MRPLGFGSYSRSLLYWCRQQSGARAAGAVTVCSIDAWSVAAKTYAADFGNAAANLTLLKTGRLPFLSHLHDIGLILAAPGRQSAEARRVRGAAGRATMIAIPISSSTPLFEVSTVEARPCVDELEVEHGAVLVDVG